MEYVTSILAFLQSAAGVGILAAVIALDHALAAIPSIAPNSSYQLITKILESAYGLLTKKA